MVGHFLISRIGRERGRRELRHPILACQYGVIPSIIHLSPSCLFKRSMNLISAGCHKQTSSHITLERAWSLFASPVRCDRGEWHAVFMLPGRKELTTLGKAWTTRRCSTRPASRFDGAQRSHGGKRRQEQI